MHYERWKKYGDFVTVRKPGFARQLGECSQEDCGRPAVAHDLCGKHYQRWAKFGDPTIVLLNRELSTEDRFWGKVNKMGPFPSYASDLGRCWIWMGGLAAGYGAFSVKNRQYKAHIISYIWLKGEVPDGWECDHLCRVTACVNPDHLEAVPPRVNKIRGFGFSGVNVRKTHCPQGHPYDEGNTYINPQGQRNCRACARKRNRDWYNSIRTI
jgi:hypothetical protein